MSCLLPEDHPFAEFQISERRSAKTLKSSGRCYLTPKEMRLIECSAEWRNAKINPNRTRPSGDIHTRVLVIGTFDLVHVGHIVFFEKTKCLGTHLTVAIGHDTLNRVYKGEGRPIYSAEHRKMIIEANRYVDEVIIYGSACPTDISEAAVRDFNDKSLKQLIKEVAPHIFVQGKDEVPPLLEGYLEAEGIQRVFLTRFSPKVSTSQYIQKIQNLKEESYENSSF